MSADNFIRVFAHQGAWGVGMGFASVEEATVPAEQSFATAREAVAFAYRWEEREPVVEYGVRLDPEVVEALERGA